ncbi:hypothetical protein POF50_002670 [Streptomyces sp. SL13]|uniref:Uncharacterized protein n=1 Tax=Streptantibioticus silvisoli TaxID=2705255 RepID=A0AA90GUM5_9ACTN|nr:hypothetical protein [Streptantibioticus silvisoli]MDI5967467.1 hypothetical protein [Streptantibioticus silvisoli]MDI5968259.1 hypothetical protein [Streptantibioticus silvisoli]
MQAPPAQAVARPTVSSALRAVESLLMRGGQQTARRNAWTAVLEDRKRARDRHEAQHLLDALTAVPAVPAPGRLAVVSGTGAAEG